jgi:peroxiredoxin
MNKNFRILAFVAIVVALISSCKTDNNYQIKGYIGFAEDSIVFLINDSKTDTIEVTDNFFTYQGSVDTVHLAYLQVPSYRKKQEFILEPGKIEISYSSKNSFIASGAYNNDRYSEYKRGMDSTTTRVLDAYQVYMKAATDEAKDEAMRLYNITEEERLVFMRAQLRKNPNYTGLMILKPIYRTDSLGNLGPYLNELSEFAYTDIYKEVDAYNTAMTTTLPGMPAPSFVLPDSSGNMIKLESFKGKYVLLDFWFTGCTYCDKLVPHLKNIYADLNSEGLEIIDISVDKKASTWLETVKKKNSPWTHLQDAEKTVTSSFGMAGFPTLILIDKDGKVAKRLVGYREEDVLRKEILSVMK